MFIDFITKVSDVIAEPNKDFSLSHFELLYLPLSGPTPSSPGEDREGKWPDHYGILHSGTPYRSVVAAQWH